MGPFSVILISTSGSRLVSRNLMHCPPRTPSQLLHWTRAVGMAAVAPVGCTVAPAGVMPARVGGKLGSVWLVLSCPLCTYAPR